jgi:PPOX class probable F420-dependent enzyme
MFEPWHVALLDSARVAHLGTIAANGEPHIVPVCFALVDGNIAIAMDEKPKTGTVLARLRNIARDPRVTLLVDHYDDVDWTNLAWLRVHGSADILERGAEWPGALAALREKYLQYRSMRLEELPMIRTTPRRLASWQWEAGAG